MSVHEIRQRLQRERNSRLAQLRAVEDTAPLVDKDLTTARKVAIHYALSEITGAEDRLTNGTYGTCQACQAGIAIERLEILPHARYCVSCQDRLT
jgi:RNA polymerase-binding transcription factor DksA